MSVNSQLLLICPQSPEVADIYKNHSTYHPGDSGLDLFVLEDMVIKAHSLGTKIGFGIQCESETSFWLLPRSSISKTPLRMSNSIGLIDQGYRGEIMATVDNLSNEDYYINKGTRLFQIAFPQLTPIEFTLVTELSKTVRGSGGFGSTS